MAKFLGAKKRIYLDYASLTPIDRRVVAEMRRYSSAEYANPSSLYTEGVAAKRALADGRARAAGFLHAHPDEIVFVSGGTEANGLALEAAGRTAHRAGIAKPHLIISAIEHSSIMETAAMMERHGVSVTRLGVDPAGLISVDELRKAITPDTFLVSIMAVNNEIGTIQPIREIAKAIRHARKNFKEARGGSSAKSFDYPLFHTDAAQAALYFGAEEEGLNVEQLGVDMLTLDSSKAYGPRGMGALYVRRGTPIEPIIYGGGQERGRRSGTENLPAIMGFAKALDIAAAERDREAERIAQLREYFLAGLIQIRPDIEVYPASIEMPAGWANPSAHVSTSPNHILNVSFPGIDNEVFILRLDAMGVACSTKSSCLRDADRSYVLEAVGADSRTAVRFSFGRQTRKADIARALAAIAKALKFC